nr:MAG TPA: hypothetical protein [Bacteriophage sp.]
MASERLRERSLSSALTGFTFFSFDIIKLLKLYIYGIGTPSVTIAVYTD